MDWTLPKTVTISEPEKVAEMFLKKYTYDETNFFYKDKLLNPEQYTYYCPLEKFTPMLLEFLAEFLRLKGEASEIIEVIQDSIYDYQEEIKEVKQKLNYLSVIFGIVLLNVLDGKKGRNSWLVNQLIEYTGYEQEINNLSQKEVRIVFGTSFL